MKSLKFILGLLLVLAAFSCEDESVITDPEPVLPETIGGVYTTDLRLVNRNEDPDLVDYYVESTISMDDGAGFLVEPGVVIQFAANTRLQLGRYSLGAGDAYIVAEGTVAEPIVFKGIDDVAGSWNGILIGMDSHDFRNSLDHCIIEYAGGANGYAVRIETGTGGGSGLLSITNTTIRYTQGNGLESDGGNVINQFSNNVFEDNSGNSILLPAQEFSHIDSNTRFEGNGLNGVANQNLVYDGVIDNDEDHVWNALNGGIYHVNKFVRIYSGSLTIQEGTSIIMGPNTGMASDENAYIRAVGAIDAPILIVGENAEIPSWDGIYIYSKNSPNEFRHCIVSEAGADGDGAFHLDSPYSNCCGYTATITNCRIQYNGGCGIYTDSENESYLVQADNEFLGNSLGTICID